MTMTTDDKMKQQYDRQVRDFLQYTPVMTWLKPLHDLKYTIFDRSNQAHVQMLEDYLQDMKPLVSGDNFEEDNNKWQAIGFQGKLPETDFRAMGLLAPICLRYMAKNYPDLVAGKYLKRPYPFSCAGINIVRFLSDQILAQKSKSSSTIINDSSPMLKLMCSEYKSSGVVNRSIKVDYEKIANNNGKITTDCFKVVLFEELFCILFESFDRIWVKHLGASKEDKELYFEFGRIFTETQQEVQKVLAKNIPDYSLFKYFLFDE